MSLDARSRQMKKLAAFFSCLALVLGIVGFAGASTITFNPDAALSSVSLDQVGTVGSASLTATLASLSSCNVAENQSVSIDFITFTGSGIGAGVFTIAASLAFNQPVTDVAQGAGAGAFFNLGTIAGGVLTWGNSVPDFFVASDGTKFSIDFEDGITIGDNTTTVHAIITNLGGSTAPVPEPSTMLLLGSGLLGFVAARRKRLGSKD